MQVKLQNIISFITQNKRIFIPLVPFILFILTFIYISTLFITSPTENPNIQVSITPASTPTSSNPTTSISNSPTRSNYGSEIHEDSKLYETNPKLNKKEELTNGIVKYTIDSSIPLRPNIIIVQGEDQGQIFERSVIPENGEKVTITEYTKLWGNPERIVKGSLFYGQDAQVYIYGSMGFAFIANPQIDKVFEIHTFGPMSADEYIRQYGEDINK